LYPTKQPVFTERNSNISIFKELDLKIPIQKKSEMINLHILRSNCPPPAATHARSIFRHYPTALSIMRWSSLSHSSAIRQRSSSTSLMLVL